MEPGILTMRQFGKDAADLPPELREQIEKQIGWLQTNETQAGKYFDSILESGWNIAIVAVDLAAGQLPAGRNGDATTNADTKVITIRYDPSQGSGWTTWDPKDKTKIIDSRKLDGTDVLAHELGHAFFDSTYIDKYHPERGIVPFAPSEYEAIRVQNEVTYMKGMPVPEILKKSGKVPDWDKYVKPRQARDNRLLMQDPDAYFRMIAMLRAFGVGRAFWQELDDFDLQTQEWLAALRRQHAE